MANWTELPKDLLELISKRLAHTSLSDHYRFSFVCAPWRIVALKHRQRFFPYRLPGLMIPGSSGNSSCQTRRFLAFPIGKVIKQEQQLPLLSVPHENLCRGAYEGWLVMVDKNMSMYILNPFSRARIDLPPVTALPKPRPQDTPMSKWYVSKAILSTSPSNSECIAMVFYGRGELAFCRPGDKAWSFIDCPKSWGYINGIYHKGQFHIVSNLGEVFICDLTPPQPKMTQLAPPSKELLYVQKWYLVESGGELLQIWKEFELETNENYWSGNQFGEEGDGDNNENDDNNNHQPDEEENIEDGEGDDSEYDEDDDSEGSDDEYDDYDYDNNYESSSRILISKTTKFEVYKLDTCGLKPKWLDVKNLDGEALFLGLNQSFSLTQSHLLGYEGNRIYFTDDDIAGHKLHTCSGNDMGIFNLEHSTTEPLYWTDSESTKPPAIWVTPKP